MTHFSNLKIIRKKKVVMNDRLKINYKTEMIRFLWASFESRFEQLLKKIIIYIFVLNF